MRMGTMLQQDEDGLKVNGLMVDSKVWLCDGLHS